MTLHVPPPQHLNSALQQARRYLTRVVPWPQEGGPPAYVNLHWTFVPKQGKPDQKLPWTGRATRSVDEAVRTLAWASSLPDTCDIYVCLSTQREAQEAESKNKRKYLKPVRLAENAIAIKCLFLDVDAKEGPNGYKDVQEAAAALAKFYSDANIPKATLAVASGGGLHAYWVLSRALTPQEWYPRACALVEATKRHGLKCDTQVTTDAARVLRVPETFNFKTNPPRPVRIVAENDDYTVERMDQALEPYKVDATFMADNNAAVAFIENPALFPRRAPLPGKSDLSAGIETAMPRDQVRNCLDAIPNNKIDWNFWNNVGMRVYAATDGTEYGLKEWQRWSDTNKTVVNATDNCTDRWNTLQQSPPNRTGAGALIKQAREALKDPKWLPYASASAISPKSPGLQAGRTLPPEALPREVTTTAPNLAASDPLDFFRLPTDDVVSRINKEHFVLRTTGKIYRESQDGELSAIQKSDFRTALGGRLAESIDKEGNAKTRPAADAWLQSPHRREYAGLEYCPGDKGVRLNFKNLWPGWGIETIAGDCTVVLDHIHEVIAARDDDKAKYFLDWSADILQNPTTKPGVALILRGPQGTGKSGITRILARILGLRNVLVTSDKDRILGRFNSGLLNKILLVGEEMLFAGDRATTDKLKHLVTGDTFPVEFKFGDVLEAKSCHRLILTSNHEQVIQAASEERRFVTYDVSIVKRGDMSYFDRLFAVGDGRDDSTAAAFMHHLLTRDLTNFKPWKAQQLFAGDEALQKQKLLSLSPPLMWLREIIDTVEGQDVSGDCGWVDGLPYAKARSHGATQQCKWPSRFPRSQALDGFRAWCAKARPYGASEFTGSPERFWREIHKVIQKGQTSRQTGKGVRVVQIDLIDLKANFQKYLRGEPL